MIPMESWYVQNTKVNSNILAWHSVTTTAIPSPFRTWTQFSPQVLMGAPLSREPSAASETNQGWYANAWCSSRPFIKELETIIQDISSRGAREPQQSWLIQLIQCMLTQRDSMHVDSTASHGFSIFLRYFSLFFLTLVRTPWRQSSWTVHPFWSSLGPPDLSQPLMLCRCRGDEGHCGHWWWCCQTPALIHGVVHASFIGAFHEV